MRKKRKKNPPPMSLLLLAGGGVAAYLLYKKMQESSYSEPPPPPPKAKTSGTMSFTTPDETRTFHVVKLFGLPVGCADQQNRSVDSSLCKGQPLSGLAGPHGGGHGGGHHGGHHGHHGGGGRGSYTAGYGPGWGWGGGETVYVVDAAPCVDPRTGALLPPDYCRPRY